MQARDTSLKVYEEIKTEGLLGRLQFEVLMTIVENGPITQGHCWKEYFPQHQRHNICPRFAELKKKGCIIEFDQRPCPVTGRLAYSWIATGNKPIDLKTNKSQEYWILYIQEKGEHSKIFRSREKAMEWKSKNQCFGVLHKGEMIR